MKLYKAIKLNDIVSLKIQITYYKGVIMNVRYKF